MLCRIHDVYIYTSEQRTEGITIDGREFTISKEPTMFKIELGDNNNYYIKATDGNYLTIANNRLTLTRDRTPWVLRRNRDISETTKRNHYQLQTESSCLSRSGRSLSTTKECNITKENQLFFFVVPDNGEDPKKIKEFFDLAIDTRVIPVDRKVEKKEDLKDADLYRIILTRSKVTITKTVQLTEIPDSTKEEEEREVVKIIPRIEDSEVTYDDGYPEREEESAEIIERRPLLKNKEPISREPADDRPSSRESDDRPSSRMSADRPSGRELGYQPNNNREINNQPSGKRTRNLEDDSSEQPRKRVRRPRKYDEYDPVSSTMKDPKSLMDDESSSSRVKGLIPNLIADMKELRGERSEDDNVDTMFKNLKRNISETGHPDANTRSFKEEEQILEPSVKVTAKTGGISARNLAGVKLAGDNVNYQTTTSYSLVNVPATSTMVGNPMMRNATMINPTNNIQPVVQPVVQSRGQIEQPNQESEERRIMKILSEPRPNPIPIGMGYGARAYI